MCLYMIALERHFEIRAGKAVDDYLAGKSPNHKRQRTSTNSSKLESPLSKPRHDGVSEAMSIGRMTQGSRERRPRGSLVQLALRSKSGTDTARPTAKEGS